MKRTKEPQIKTLERLLIHLLKKSPSTSPVRNAFEKMLEHFIDADFLYSTCNEKIILLIYQKDFYSHHYAYALPQLLNVDNKFLLICRKHYLQLFAKYYLGLTNNSNNVFSLLYIALEREELLLENETKNNCRPLQR